MFKNENPYLSTSEIEDAYEKIKGSRKGITAFLAEVKKIGSRTKNGAFVYKDEEALYQVFERHLKDELEIKGIDCFGRLMQYIS